MLKLGLRNKCDEKVLASKFQAKVKWKSHERIHHTSYSSSLLEGMAELPVATRF